jgi:dTDP-glucose 4,6-dehydratase
MRVLVVGASGFVGFHVVTHILECTDWDVITLDRHPSIHEDLQANHIIHDLRIPIRGFADRVLGEVDVIINLAASADVTQFMREVETHVINNVGTTLNLLQWAANQTALRAFVQVSTNEVYGPAPFHEHAEWSPILPPTPYSASKAAQEMMGIGWWRTYDVPVVILNTMHLFGENQPQARFIPTATRALLRGDPVPIYGEKNGATWRSQFRQWTYARDFAHAICHVVNYGVPRYTPGLSRPDRWHIAGTEMSNRKVAQLIAEYLEVPLKIDWQKSARPGHDLRYALDSSAIRLTGFAEPYGTEAGLKKTVDWIKRKAQPR